MPNETEIWTTLKVLSWTTGYLRERGVDNARREAEWMLSAATGLDRVGLYLSFEKPLSDQELSLYRSMVSRRARREPLQYILGSQEFDALQFIVTSDVLIPRHDTETLLNEALLRAEERSAILDIGTGTGCLAVSLSRRIPTAGVTAVDISAAALEVARRNAENHAVTVELLHGSFMEPVAGRSFDIIVSNPPYITSADLEVLQPEVRDFEPRLALDGGQDGLDAYRIIVAEAPKHLNPGGWLLLESGEGQASALLEMFERIGFSQLFSTTDAAGIERVVGGCYGTV